MIIVRGSCCSASRSASDASSHPAKSNSPRNDTYATSPAVWVSAEKTGAAVSEISHMAVWGNHSPTMYPDLFNAKVRGERAWDVVGDEAWVADEFIPRVGKRGAEIIEARGASSAASAANAAIDHVRDWALGADGLRSMAIHSTGAYGVEEGVVSSFPVRVSGG